MVTRPGPGDGSGEATPGQAMAARWVFGSSEAARRLGVPPTTLRSWHRRYGLEPEERTAGGHRRYSAADLARLRRMYAMIQAGVPAVHAAVIADRDQTLTATGAPAGEDLTEVLPHGLPAARRLARAMSSLDPAQVAAIARAAIRRRGIMGAWQDLFAPALIALGEQWALTGCHVEVEHVTSSVLETVLRHRSARAGGVQPCGRRVLLVAAPGEAHTLPLSAAAAALAERGIDVVVPGELPLQALGAAIGALRPHAVVLWSRQRGTADPDALAVAAQSTSSIAGSLWAAGPGWQPGQVGRGIGLLTTLAQTVEATGGTAPP